MRRARLVVSLIASACIGLAGCSGAAGGGSAASGVDYSKLGTPVPSPTGPYQTPEPPEGPPGETADPTQQILYDLRQRVVRMAGIPIQTEASCAGGVITGTVDQNVTCSVTYQGLTVEYQVEITGGTPTFTWVATTDTGLLTAEGVGQAYWAKYGTDASEVRCDPMPEQRLVKLGEDTDYRCYHKSGDTWTEHAVVLTDGAITFVEPGS